jgi:homospermidine synthase
VVGVRSDWTPLKDRNVLFPEPNLDPSDPWQFENFRVRR